MREIALKVTLSVDDDVTLPEVKDYVRSTLEAWGGTLNPESSMEGRVKVVRYKSKEGEQ